MTTLGRDRLRLACLIDSLATGGAERLVVTFAEEARRRPELNFRVITLCDDRTPFREEIERMGVVVEDCKGRSLADPFRFLRLLRLLRGRADHIHAHLASSIALGGLAAEILGLPFAATVHNVRPSTRRMTGPRRRLYQWSLRRARTRRIAVGQAVAETNMEDAAGGTFSVVPNAVPPSAIWPEAARDQARRELREELGVGPEETVLFAAGLVIGQKGYPDLIEAFSRACGGREHVTLAIAGGVGWDELKAQLDARIIELGLGDRIRFLGVRRDIPRLLAGADIFVSASHWEGAPVSLLEAMANGLPCLVTDVGDNARTLAGLGLPTPPAGAPDRFADALARLIDAPDLRKAAGEAARRRAVEMFGPAAWVDRLVELYAADLAAHGRLAPRKDRVRCASS